MPGALEEIVPPEPGQASPDRLQKQISTLDLDLALQGGQVGALGGRKGFQNLSHVVPCLHSGAGNENDASAYTRA